jgi:hypothetical protein
MSFPVLKMEKSIFFRVIWDIQYFVPGIMTFSVVNVTKIFSFQNNQMQPYLTPD